MGSWIEGSHLLRELCRITCGNPRRRELFPQASSSNASGHPCRPFIPPDNSPSRRVNRIGRRARQEFIYNAEKCRLRRRASIFIVCVRSTARTRKYGPTDGPFCVLLWCRRVMRLTWPLCAPSKEHFEVLHTESIRYLLPRRRTRSCFVYVLVCIRVCVCARARAYYGREIGRERSAGRSMRIFSGRLPPRGLTEITGQRALRLLCNGWYPGTTVNPPGWLTTPWHFLRLSTSFHVFPARLPSLSLFSLVPPRNFFFRISRRIRIWILKPSDIYFFSPRPPSLYLALLSLVFSLFPCSLYLSFCLFFP